MHFVNPYFLEVPLRPITGLGDGDEIPEVCLGIDPNNPADVKRIIAALILPYVRGLNEVQRDKVKLAYRYYLTQFHPAVSFERVFNSLLPPFDPPDDCRELFVWLWEECFPGEDYRLDNPDGYTVIADINEPLNT